MQVRNLFAATLLSLTAVAAMAQELDPRNDRMFNHPSAATGYQEPGAATRHAQAQALQAAGDEAVEPMHGAAAKASVQPTSDDAQKPVRKDVVGTADAAASLQSQGTQSRAQVKSELAAWRASHKTVVGELG